VVADSYACTAPDPEETKASSGAVRAVGRWLVIGIKALSAAALAAVALPTVLGLVLVAVMGVLLGLPLVLVITLALAAVYSPDPDRQGAAKEVLDRLLNALRPPREPRAPTPRQRGRPPPRK
jgi:hypothetical protein